MAYIGKQPTVGNFVKLDAITATATTTFNLLNGGVAYFPQSANHCLVSLNGILQAPTDSFTISGSTIIFSNALTTSDVIDFIIVLGDVLNIGTPSDNTVSLAKLTATGTKNSTTFLRGDNTFATAGGTNTPAFSVTRTSGQTLTTGVTTKIQGNIELLDSNANYDNATNYRFTPTTSGFYQFNLCCQPSRTDSNVLEGLSIYIYKNGSNALSNSFGIDASDQNVFGYSISGVLEANGSTDYFEAFINFSVTTGTPSIGTANGTASFNFSGFKIIQ
jgi:hypothetical protein